MHIARFKDWAHAHATLKTFQTNLKHYIDKPFWSNFFRFSPKNFSNTTSVFDHLGYHPFFNRHNYFKDPILEETNRRSNSYLIFDITFYVTFSQYHFICTIKATLFLSKITIYSLIILCDGENDPTDMIMEINR